MDIASCSFEHLPFSSLFRDYITNFDHLSDFYAYNPHDPSDLHRRVGDLDSFDLPDGLQPALRSFHEGLQIGHNQSGAREKLFRKDALAVVTGQQTGIYGGPLFTIYKTLSVIILAEQIEKETGRPVVPVFWLADEDHDFEEIKQTGVLGRDDFHMLFMEQESAGEPVSEISIGEHISEFSTAFWSEIPDTDFTGELKELIDSLYREGANYAVAFARLMDQIFGKHGLLIAGSQHKDLKALTADIMATAIEKDTAIFESIEGQSLKIESIYERQVENGDTNLFYFNDDGARTKIRKEKDKYVAGDDTWSKEELIKVIRSSPERFSPNVFLRPVLQDEMLPTVAYVAGPGEISYYGQMKHFYECFDKQMPLIIPRISATLLESSIERILKKLPFDIWEYDKRIEDLESEYVEQAEKTDVEAIFGKWMQQIKGLTEEPRKQIKEIDPTLDGTVGKTESVFLNELNKLKGRVYRSIKEQEKVQINRIEKIKINLFPNGGLQERAVSPLIFMNKYGPDIWDRLLEKLRDKELPLTEHQIIHL